MDWAISRSASGSRGWASNEFRRPNRPAMRSRSSNCIDGASRPAGAPPTWLSTPRASRAAQRSQAQAPGSDPAPLQEAVQHPDVRREPRRDFGFIFGLHDQQDIACAIERPSQQNETLHHERIHEIGMGAPTLVLFHRLRVIPLGSTRIEHGEDLSCHGVLHPCEVHDPVGFPTGAFIEREGLLPSRRVARDARPHEAHADCPALVLVLAEERADALGETALHRRRHPARPPRVEPVDRPPGHLGIPGAQSHAAIGSARQVDLAFIGVAEAVQDLARGTAAVELDPVVAVGQPLQQIAMVDAPDPHQEVEIGIRGQRTLDQGIEHGGLLSTGKLAANTCQEPSGIYVKFSTMRASRLMSILLLLQNRGRLTAEQLEAHFEVYIRTIYRDIDQLSAAEVPVYADRGPGGGFQLLDGYRTKLTGLSSAEAETLFIAGLPGPAAEMGLADALATAQLKLTAALPESARANARRLSARFHLDPVDWFRSAASARLLPAIATAVWGEMAIDVQYKRSGSDKATSRRLQPLGLVLKAGTWYVVASVGPLAGDNVRTYRVSNILDLQQTGERFTRPKDFDLVRFWTASSRAYEIGIYRGTAQLRVSKRGMARLETLG